MKNMEKIISIVVPVYNVEPYIRCCVDSVLSQSFGDFELILVDDGSTDNSGEICDAYALKDSRIQVIHQENAGQGKARNAGTALASGKYIIYLDSDDYWMPDTLKTLYSEAEKNQTQVLIFGAEMFWDGMEKPKDASCDLFFLNVQNNVVKTGSEILKTGLDNNEYQGATTNKFYRLDYLRSMGLSFDEGTIHEDVRFSFLSCLYAERAECIGENLYRYRHRPGSTIIGQTFQNRARGLSVCLKELLDLWLSHTLPEEQALLLERYCVIRVRFICEYYKKSRKSTDRNAAGCVRKEVRPALKPARKLPSLPVILRVGTYNLYLYYLLTGIYGKMKRGFEK